MSFPPPIEHLETDQEDGRELYVVELESPECLPDLNDILGDYFVALIVWNASTASDQSIRRLARRLIDAGGVYFCTWGIDCERVHDLIDTEWVMDGFDPESESTIVTTCHDKDSLAEAITFATDIAFPADVDFDGCRSVVAFCIGCPDEAEEVRTAFRDAGRS